MTGNVASGVDRWLGPLAGVEAHRLDNGLEVRLLPSAQAPIIVVSLWYRVGARDEEPEHAGIAHFLEHMMFKGSDRFPMGAIDKLTQSLGGENNAFTSHDVTSYYFSFAAEHWRQALEIEADRMAGLTLDPAEIERERDVILEEISMYEDDPWDALELEGNRRYYGDFSYGRSILGTRESVRAIDRRALEAFHRAHYRPDNAVLVVAGDLEPGTLGEIEARLGKISRPPSRASLPSRLAGWDGGFEPPSELRRVRLEKGNSPRFMLTLPTPKADHPDFVAWRLWMTVLGGGRASRLHRRLVDDGKLCSSMSADVSEMAGPGVAAISAELLSGIDPKSVEEAVLDAVRELLGRPPAAGELDTARRLLLADWVFGLERIQRQAITAGHAASVFGDDRYPERCLERLLTCRPEEVTAVAQRQATTPAGGPGGVLGWAAATESR